MNLIADGFGYLFDGSRWGGETGFAARIVEHLQYTLIAVLVSVVIAVPIGLLVGHTKRGAVAVIGTANALRALPTLGILLLLVLLTTIGLLPAIIALVLLGVPPLIAGAYAGVNSVDPAVVDAARSMGMTESQVLLRVELPNALPLLVAGLRNATLQIVATTTVAAYASLGGLGRFLIDGVAQRDYAMMVAASILVTALALALDAVLAVAAWAVIPGTGRLSRPDGAVVAAISSRTSKPIQV